MDIPILEPLLVALQEASANRRQETFSNIILRRYKYKPDGTILHLHERDFSTFNLLAFVLQENSY